MKSQPVAAAKYLGKVFVGFIHLKGFLLFIVKLKDGSVKLIKAAEGSAMSLKLLELRKKPFE